MAERTFLAPKTSTHDLTLHAKGFQVRPSRLKRGFFGVLLLVLAAGLAWAGLHTLRTTQGWELAWAPVQFGIAGAMIWVALRPWRTWCVSVSASGLTVTGKRVEAPGEVPLSNVQAVLATRVVSGSSGTNRSHKPHHTYRVGVLLDDGAVVGLLQTRDGDEAQAAREALEVALVEAGTVEAPVLDHVPEARTRVRADGPVPSAWPEPWPHPRFEVRQEEERVWITPRHDRRRLRRRAAAVALAAAAVSAGVLGWLYMVHGPWGLVPMLGPGGLGVELLRLLAYTPLLLVMEAVRSGGGPPVRLRPGPVHAVVQPGKLLVVASGHEVAERIELGPVHDVVVEEGTLALVTTSGSIELPLGPLEPAGDRAWARDALRYAMVRHGGWRPGRPAGELADEPPTR